MAQTTTRGSRKKRTGKVLSDKMDKTIVVQVERKVSHPIYKKVIKILKNYKVHDESCQAKIGDIVEIMETRPLSKDKRWRLLNILKRGV
ncbi:30S ribosomal protein S17 [bacterium]|nr:30S ribosomal protein S17 [bacterium]